MQIEKRWKSFARFFVIAALILFMLQLPGSYAEASTDTVVKTASVTLHANGGSYKAGGYGVIDEDTCKVEFDIYSSGGVSFVNVDMRPQWNGKALLGWSTNKNSQWETWSEWFEQWDEQAERYKFALPLDGSITDLYAIWIDEYSITLNGNGGYFGTSTDRYGKTTYLETKTISIHKTKDGSRYTWIPKLLTEKEGVKHIGWSTDKNAKRPEYEGIGSIPLDRKPPEVLYAVFGDPEAGEVTIIPKQTAYKTDLHVNKTGTIEFTIKWSGVVKPENHYWNAVVQEGSSKVLKCTFDSDGEYELSGDAYVETGKIHYEALTTGTVKLKIYAGMNGKEGAQTVTINVTDSSKQESTSDNTGKKVEKGKSYTVNKLNYKVTNADMKGSGTVTLTGTTQKKAKLTKLTVPKTVKINGTVFKVTAIGTKAFNKFTKIKSVTIGDNVKTIGTSAFAGNTKLTKVTIGKGVTTIGKAAFSGDKKLKTITIKSTKLKSVGKNAIKSIDKKATIKVPKAQLKNYKKLFSSKTGFKKTMKVGK